MALTRSQIEEVQQLASAAATLHIVTDADKATNGILRQIERIVVPAQPVAPGKPARTPIQERIDTAQASSVRGVYGLLVEIVRDPETTVAELKTVCVYLGYKNIGVIPI